MFDSIKKLLALRKLQGLWKKKDLTSQKWWEEFVGTALKVPEINTFARDTMESLKGYKTYILAAAIAAVVIAKQLGYIDEATANNLLTLLGAGTAATMAAKINRTELIARTTQTAAIQTNNVIQPLVSPSQHGMSAGQTMRRDAGLTSGSSHPADSNYARTPRK